MSAELDILQEFGRNLRRIRLACGLSQETLAELCDLDRTYVSGIERGRRNVGLRNIAALASALEVPIAKLFEGFGENDDQVDS